MASSGSGMLAQSRFGSVGNLEVVAPVGAGGLVHLWRNDDGDRAWSRPVWFGSGTFSSTALIHGTFDHGNLEVVGRLGNRLLHYGRLPGANRFWEGPFVVAGGVRGEPGFVEGPWGEPVRNYEVVAPLATGGLAHWWRDNNAAGYPWRGPTPIGAGTGTYDAAALIVSSYGGGRTLEVVARRGSELVHFWRSPAGAWSGPATFAQGVTGTPAFIEGSAGRATQPAGNFEAVAPLADGRIGHWWRLNTAEARWSAATPFGPGAPVVAVGLTENRSTSPRVLEVVARRAGRLEHWRRNPGTLAWEGPTVFFTEPAPCHGATVGQSRVQLDSGIVAIHAALMHTGRVVLFGFSDHDQNVGASRVLDPVSGALQQVSGLGGHNPFCGGHSHLADGRLLVAGGHNEPHHRMGVHVFDAETLSWKTQPDHMENGRWYPTCTTLPNGKVFVISGTKGVGPPSETNAVNNTFQLFDPATGTMGNDRPVVEPFGPDPAFRTVDLYPFCYVLPSGKVLVHSRRTTRFVNPATGAWDAQQLQARHEFSRSYPGEGTSVLLPLTYRDGYRARVLIAGGGGADVGDALTEDTPATDTVEILDLGVPSTAWRKVAPMGTPRVLPDAVLLPDGTVAVVGGSRSGRADLAGEPVFDVELFDPATETWSAACPTRVPRMYHSTALLLPDGRVMIGGKDGLFQPDAFTYPEHRVEMFHPPYLFRGPRPTITGSPVETDWDRAMEIGTPQASAITSVVLVRAGSVTHSFNMDQRLVELRITGRTADRVTVLSPPNARVAPPGYYLLFLLAGGIPSVAEFIAVRTPRTET